MNKKLRFLAMLVIMFAFGMTVFGQEQVVNSFPRVGTWSVIGRDSENWIGNMVIDEIKNNSFSGYFDWIGGSNYGGREYFRGEYEPRTRTVSIRGYRLANDRGIGLGNYEAFLVGDDFRLGRWTGGVWEAKWQK